MAPTISFGVELEFLVQIERVSVAPPQAAPMPRATRPKPIPFSAPMFSPAAVQEVANHICNTICGAGVRNVTISNVIDSSKAPYISKWTVAQDASVIFPRNLIGDWLNIELISPPYSSASTTALSEVAKVVQCLATAYHISLNPSCGFHVHCGIGLRQEDRIQLWLLKRLALLFWAVDPVLSRLHPPERLINTSVKSIRLDSRLVDTASMPDTQKILDHMSKEGYLLPQETDAKAEEERELGLHCLTQNETPANNSPWKQQSMGPQKQKDTRETLEKAWLLPWDDQAALTRHISVNEYSPIPQRPETINNAYEATCSELLLCANKAQIGVLLSSPSTMRPNYSFANYRYEQYWDFSRRNQTVEFRQAGGTMDSQWIATWVKICVGLMEYARDTTMEELMGLSRKLEQRETGNYGTDCSVVDLLGEIGKDGDGLADVVKQRFEDVGRRGWYY
ncbi:hypothetical protein Daus18300_005742 [Diaporthe australafricana]|uniref:Amidoligase enzyme n=1 Tax=Diaporthe australafricana TaxID=127596 RepID=A0ABR3WYZ2_9PEZI